jgi:mono/diheme cytochrome c family protein
LVVAGCALATGGCGGSGSSGGGGNVHVLPPGNPAAGKGVFRSAGCDGCHTFAAAGAHGTFGPNLDDSHLTYRRTFVQVHDGGGGMPSFGDQLTGRQIAAVAAFVVRERSG